MAAFLSAILFASTSPAAAQEAHFDAVAAAPTNHKVLLEDDKIRVLRVEVAPGTTEPIHNHSWPSVMYFEIPQPITYIVYKLVNGRPVETKRFDAPALQVSETVRFEPEELHAVLNRGSTPFVAVRIEFKDGISVKYNGAAP